MSYEDSGYKPGKIYGSEKCARQCGDCDGEHHFYIGGMSGCEDEDAAEDELPMGLDPAIYFVCKHCGTYAAAVDEDYDVPTEESRDSKVDRLLHDAEHADSGRMMANMMKDTKSAQELADKRDCLLAEANKLDPEHECDSWKEYEASHAQMLL